MLGGGLGLGALHEIRSAEARAGGAAHGFVAGLIALLARTDARPVLWVSEAGAAREAGAPYGPGLARFGLDPGRLITVSVEKSGEALWVFEEGLRCAGLAAVIGEVWGNPAILDLTASRRLALRARDGGVTGLLLRQGGMAEPGAAFTRFAVSPLPAEDAEFSFGIGRPAWRLQLERNRLGPTGTINVEWHHAKRAFREPVCVPAAVPVAPPPISADRPARAPEGGTVLPFIRSVRTASAGRDRRQGKKRAAAGGA
jgi:protein ImuA